LAGVGANEGAVIARGRDGLADNNRSVIRLSEESHWVVQTNWDNWIPIDSAECRGTIAALPAWVRYACHEVAKLLYGDSQGCEVFCQLTSDGRAEKARTLMAPIDPDSLDGTHIFEVLSTPPVLSTDTAFTSIMEPLTSNYMTTVRDHPNGKKITTDTQRGMLSPQKFTELFAALLRRTAEIVV
jgi:hypothetical protein